MLCSLVTFRCCLHRHPQRACFFVGNVGVVDGDDGVIDEGVGVDVDDGSKAEDDGGGVDSLDAVIRSDRTVSHYAFLNLCER